MKVGLIARSEDRGLGNLTWEWAQHMHPDRVLVVVPNHPLQQRPERYTGAFTLPWDHHGDSTLNESVVRDFLDGLDVVYSAETFYDWRVCDWARELGVRTVCHVMPEYYRHGQRTAPPAPDVWWAPTLWRLDTLDPRVRVVPVPIATERFAPLQRELDGPMRWLHVAGAKAAADRNGTQIVVRALAALKHDHHVTIRSQDPIRQIPNRSNVTVRVVPPTGEYWEGYDEVEALVLPRRYAGLCLPAFEAMAAGLALMMPLIEPQLSEWPIVGLPVSMRGVIRTVSGPIRLAEVPPRVLAAYMDALAEDPDALADAQRRSLAFADEHSWASLEPMIREELERACSRV